MWNSPRVHVRRAVRETTSQGERITLCGHMMYNSLIAGFVSSRCERSSEKTPLLTYVLSTHFVCFHNGKQKGGGTIQTEKSKKLAVHSPLPHKKMISRLRFERVDIITAILWELWLHLPQSNSIQGEGNPGRAFRK